MIKAIIIKMINEASILFLNVILGLLKISFTKLSKDLNELFMTLITKKMPTASSTKSKIKKIFTAMGYFPNPEIWKIKIVANIATIVIIPIKPPDSLALTKKTGAFSVMLIIFSAILFSSLMNFFPLVSRI